MTLRMKWQGKSEQKKFRDLGALQVFTTGDPDDNVLMKTQGHNSAVSLQAGTMHAVADETLCTLIEATLTLSYA